MLLDAFARAHACACACAARERSYIRVKTLLGFPREKRHSVTERGVLLMQPHDREIAMRCEETGFEEELLGAVRRHEFLLEASTLLELLIFSRLFNNRLSRGSDR